MKKDPTFLKGSLLSTIYPHLVKILEDKEGEDKIVEWIKEE